MHLWPRSVEALYSAADCLPRLSPSWDKRYLDLMAVEGFQKAPVPLGAVDLGARNDDVTVPFVEHVDRDKATVELVGNAYGALRIDKGMRAKEFGLLTKIVNSVPVRRVTATADPALLPRLCDVILQDYRRVAHGSFAST